MRDDFQSPPVFVQEVKSGFSTSRRVLSRFRGTLGGAIALIASLGAAEAQTLITDVNIFDGVNEALTPNANVLIEDNLIAAIFTDPMTSEGATAC